MELLNILALGGSLDDRVGQLREQARVLHVLAASFDIPSIRDELLALPERCETLAASIEKTVKQSLSVPIDSSSKDPTSRPSF